MNMRLEQLKIADDIIKSISKDGIYEQIIGIDDIHQWYPDMIFSAWFNVFVDDDHIGLIMVRLHSNNAAFFHGGVYEKFRGLKTPAYIKEALKKIKGTGTLKFMTTIASSNEPAIMVVVKAGFVRKGTIKDGYRDADLILFGEDE